MSTKDNLAFLFPGQGSQKVGMLADIAEQNPVVAETFAQASEALGYDVWQLVQDGPQEKLNMTEVTQPVLLTCSVAVWRAIQSKTDVLPKFVAGHSLGEWSALVAAGVVAFEDAVKLVRSRGKYMQEAVPVGQGAMAAIIGLDDDVVEKICDAAAQGQVVSAVNYNSPGQLVIAGEVDAVDRAIVAAKEAGAKRALPLPVSAPFHTSLMKPAADRLAAEIESTTFNAPKIAIVHNVTANVETDPQKIKALMIEQIYSAVRWVECVEFLAEKGVESVVECGPGKVLAGLNRRIVKSMSCATTDTQSSLNATLEDI